MAVLTFKTLSFKQEKDELVVTLLKLFYAKIPWEELESIGPFSVKDAHSLEFKDLAEKKASTKFSFLLAKHFEHLKNKLNGNSATYIHSNSGIPLIGNVAFGIVYRNSSVIEIKPITSCNLNCIYCSISEGLQSKKHDFVLEKDYLVEELKKLLDFVGEKVEVHIGVQGEPFLYADLEELISDIQKMKMVQRISVDTNATLLSREIIDRLAKNDKLQLNISLDALEQEKAALLAGTEKYNLQHIIDIITYASEKMRVIVAPVFLPGYNEEEMEKIIEYVKSLKKQPQMGIQNFLSYKTGKNPAKSLPWEKFYQRLKDLEEKNQIKLILSKEDFDIRKTQELEKPFKEGDIVPAVLKCPDRFPNTSIAAAGNRNISVANCPFQGEKKVKVKITRDKHNIFNGKIVR